MLVCSDCRAVLRLEMQEAHRSLERATRWEPDDTASGYVETGTEDWIPGSRDFDGEGC